MTTPPDPVALLLRSKSYLVLLVLAAIIGVPVSAAAYFFLALVSKLEAAGTNNLQGFRTHVNSGQGRARGDGLF